eukprot:9537200-Ditylum_brightwellii.AAC.1
MGEVVKQDLATSIKEMLTLLDTVEELAKVVTNFEEQYDWVLLGAFAAIAYAGSFRGPELFLVDLHSLIKHQEEGTSGPTEQHHVVVVLLDCFKGKT